MKDINRVTLVGRMARDGELKYTGDGYPVMNGSIAVTKSKQQGDKWLEEAHFFNFRIWGKLAESVAKYCLKGKRVGIDGTLHLDRWKAQDGGTRQAVVINADQVCLYGQRNETVNAVDQAAHSSTDFNDDIPF